MDYLIVCCTVVGVVVWVCDSMQCAHAGVLVSCEATYQCINSYAFVCVLFV
jgi:hypothetical protein